MGRDEGASASCTGVEGWWWWRGGGGGGGHAGHRKTENTVHIH